MNIVLTGFMASGKTAVGKELAEKLHMRFVDVDEVIERDTELTIARIFGKFGEQTFRDLETKAIKCVAMLDNYVIATGGGAVLRMENVSELRRNGRVIYLAATPETILRRVGKAQTRPLLAKEQDKLAKIKELLAKREPFYQNCDLIIDTSDLSVTQVVEKILAQIEAQ